MSEFEKCAWSAALGFALGVTGMVAAGRPVEALAAVPVLGGLGWLLFLRARGERG